MIAGLNLVNPSSVTTSGGTASVTSNGLVEFESASAIVLNDVFDATYDEYLVVVYVDDGACVAENFHFQFTSAGSSSSANYYQQVTTATTSGTTARSGPLDAWRVINGSTTASANAGACYMTLFSPALAAHTTGVRLEGSGEGGAFLRNAALTHNVATAYDGLRFYYGPLDQAPTYGNIAVYGMTK